jgi:hypothetical protein
MKYIAVTPKTAIMVNIPQSLRVGAPTMGTCPKPMITGGAPPELFPGLGSGTFPFPLAVLLSVPAALEERIICIGIVTSSNCHQISANDVLYITHGQCPCHWIAGPQVAKFKAGISSHDIT